METKERIERAVETYDHLLWEAIIRVCGGAISKAFNRTENSVRVVYRIWKNDPRNAIPKIMTEIEYLISRPMQIKKLGKKYRNSYTANNLCSRGNYQLFLFDLVLKEQGINIDDPQSIPVVCDFVEFKDRNSNAYICCPCTGDHLGNTRELRDFNINLQEPRRIGKDTYEFRFKILDR